jgi:acetyltransferase-like isoleucine patch superfamily enzyme
LNRINSIIHENVTLGENTVIEDFVLLGKPPRGRMNGELPLTIGSNGIIRTSSIIYAGSIIGNKFQTGDCARIRDDNIIGNNVSIGSYTVVENSCIINDNARVHSNCFICEYSQIEENAWIGPGVIFTNVLHPPCPVFKNEAPIKGAHCTNGPRIRKNAVVGAGAVLLPGVTIGTGALIGAGSVIIEDVPPGTVVVGNPGKVVKKINELDCPLNFYKKGEIYSWRK